MDFATWAEANWMYVDNKADAEVIWNAAVAAERERWAKKCASGHPSDQTPGQGSGGYGERDLPPGTRLDGDFHGGGGGAGVCNGEHDWQPMAGGEYCPGCGMSRGKTAA